MIFCFSLSYSLFKNYRAASARHLHFFFEMSIPARVEANTSHAVSKKLSLFE